MKKICILILGLNLIAPLIYGQTPASQEDRVEAFRIGFITEKLQLTPEESQTFWPLYNEYRKKQKELRSRDTKAKDIGLMSDAEIEKYIDIQLSNAQAEVELQKKLYGDLRKVLPMRKIARLLTTEREFNNRLLQTIAQRREVVRKN